MQVPALYCGLADDVRKVVRKQVRAYLRGAPWLEATSGPTVSTADVPGIIYLEGPTFVGTPKTPQIYLYMPFLELYRAVEKKAVPFERLADVRVEALTTAWGTAAMVGGPCGRAYIREWPDCAPELLRSALKYWDLLDAEGPRYSSGLMEGSRLWVVAYGFHYAMRMMGIGHYPAGRDVVFEPRAFLAEHGLLDKVMSATAHP